MNVGAISQSFGRSSQGYNGRASKHDHQRPLSGQYPSKADINSQTAKEERRDIYQGRNSRVKAEKELSEVMAKL